MQGYQSYNIHIDLYKQYKIDAHFFLVFIFRQRHIQHLYQQLLETYFGNRRK